MKGNPELINTLNDLLAGELTAINQYMLHAEMCEDWGYDKLHENFEKRAITEMKHAEKLMERILFLEGKPIVSHLNDIRIGSTVPEQVDNDHAAEVDTVKDYNEAIVLAGEVLDYATRDILMEILQDEDRHVDELEELQDQIEQMSLQIFLSTQNSPRRVPARRLGEPKAGAGRENPARRRPFRAWSRAFRNPYTILARA